ncbi:Exosome complex component MTR3 [Hondaea fermentalgiana]|uniref:Exosome complex component MTR3 n=1 Tax=Hondaea fermentalgiana TaxID=2315210 RepID=A0A2R5GE21_9STRA|nr:Exosome complex component MTR3 [Hondaea fermentalgiana]|eukprot:GBG28579.1 Exosome complex component MTR3 [Hondaea fermentalgiana]
MATLYRPRVVRRARDETPSRGARIGPTDARSHKPSGARSGGIDTETEENEGPKTFVEVDTGVVGGAAGSAYVKVNGTRVLCSVRGPRAIKKSSDFGDEGALDCTVRLAPFALYGEAAGPTSSRNVETRRIKREQMLSGALLRAIKGSIRLDRFPKSVLEIDALVLSDDGAAPAVIPSCASLAIADSGVEMRDLVACAQVGVSDAAGKGVPSFISSPTLAQQAACSSVMTMALLPASETISDLTIKGTVSHSLAGETSKRCFEGCITLHRQMREHLVAKAEQAFADLEGEEQ